MSNIYQSRMVSQVITLIFCGVVGVGLIILAYSIALPTI